MKTKTEIFDDDVEIYLKSIAHIPTLTREEERELLAKAKAGDQDATNKIVESNLKFVVSIAKGYRGMGVPFSDLIMEGNFGLYKAIEKFDPEKGTKFITYAVWWIRYLIGQAIEKFNGNNDEVLADDYTLECVEDTEYEYQEKPESINQEFENDITTIQSKSQAVDELMKCLKEREVKILSMYFGLYGEKEKTLTEISHEFNMSSERVRQIVNTSLTKLKYNAVGDDELFSFKELID